MNKNMTVLEQKMPKKSTYALQILSLIALIVILLGNFSSPMPRSISETEINPKADIKSLQGINNSNFTLNI